MTKIKFLHGWIFVLSAILFFDVLLSSEVFSYFVVFFVFLSLLFFNFNKNLKIVFFLLPSFYYFSTMGIPGNPLTYFLILLFFKYIFYGGHKYYDSLNLILTVMILIISILNSLLSNAYNLMELIRWSLLFVFTVLLMSEKDSSRNFAEFGKYFIIGFFISSIIGFIGFKLGGNLYDLTRTVDNQNIINRFSGLSGDPNSYGMYALLVLTFLLQKLEVELNSKKTVLLWALVFILGFLSIITVSRAFVVGFIFIIFMFFIFNLRKKTNAKMMFLLISFMILGFLVGNYFGFFDNFIRRFEYTTLNELSGGRNIIFMEYVKGFVNGGFWNYFFGSGVVGHPDFYFHDIKDFNSTGYFSKAFGTHNTFLELLVSFGLLGSIPFVILLYRCVLTSELRNNNRLRYFDFIPLLVVFIYFFSLQNLAKYNFYFILFFLSMYLQSRNRDYLCR